MATEKSQYVERSYVGDSKTGTHIGVGMMAGGFGMLATGYCLTFYYQNDMECSQYNVGTGMMIGGLGLFAAGICVAAMSLTDSP